MRFAANASSFEELQNGHWQSYIFFILSWETVVNVLFSFLCAALYNSTKKKKTHLLIYSKNRYKKQFWLFSIETFWKIFKKSFNLDQSQVCISNGLEARALQRQALICKNAILHRDCKTGKGKVFIQTNAISKRIKIELPDWRQMKDLSKGFQTV